MPCTNHISQAFTYLVLLALVCLTQARDDLKFSVSDLDTYLLPHPLLGKMTIREISLWTAYHTEHHYKILKMN